MMSSQKHFYNMVFENRVLKADGVAFQKLFEDLMRKTCPGFSPVRARPFRGDGGNDGWIEAEGAYYQVYGPEIDNQNPEDHAIKKAKDDFRKLKENWDETVPIKKFFFVFNTYFKSPTGDLQKCMTELRQENALDEAKIIDSHGLLKMFDNLDEDDKISIVGDYSCAPPTLSELFYPMAEILRQLAQKDHDPLSFLGVSAPDFSDKINFNGLGSDIKQRLESYSHFTGEIDDILKNNRGDAQNIVSPLRNLYERSKTEVADGPNNPDARYLWMLEELTPSNVKNTPQHTAYRNAIEIIFAKYFESCDLYESPGSINPS